MLVAANLLAFGPQFCTDEPGDHAGRHADGLSALTMENLIASTGMSPAIYDFVVIVSALHLGRDAPDRLAPILGGISPEGDILCLLKTQKAETDDDAGLLQRMGMRGRRLDRHQTIAAASEYGWDG